MARSTSVPRAVAISRAQAINIPASLNFSGNKVVTATPLSFAGGFTVAWSCTIQKYTNNARSILGNYVASSTAKIAYNVTAGKWAIRAIDGGSLDQAIDIPILNTWHTFAITRNAANKVDFYMDGVLLGRLFSDVAQAGVFSFDTIGISTGTQTHAGYMAKIATWSRALTAAEVTAHFKGPMPSGPTLYYRLDEGAGLIAYDSSGSGNNGVITADAFVADTPSKARKQLNSNLVANGNFEFIPPVNVPHTASSKFMDGTAGGSSTNELFKWYITFGGSVVGSALFDTAIKRSGNASLKLVCTTPNAASSVGMSATYTTAIGPSAAQQKQYMIPVLPNTSYTLTGWIKTDSIVSNDSRGARIRAVEYSSSSTGGVAENNTAYITGTNDWALHTKTFTTNASTRFIHVWANIIGDTIGTAWFDEIYLQTTTLATRNAT